METISNNLFYNISDNTSFYFALLKKQKEQEVIEELKRAKAAIKNQENLQSVRVNA